MDILLPNSKSNKQQQQEAFCFAVPIQAFSTICSTVVEASSTTTSEQVMLEHEHMAHCLFEQEPILAHMNRYVKFHGAVDLSIDGCMRCLFKDIAQSTTSMLLYPNSSSQSKDYAHLYQASLVELVTFLTHHRILLETATQQDMFQLHMEAATSNKGNVEMIILLETPLHTTHALALTQQQALMLLLFKSLLVCQCLLFVMDAKNRSHWEKSIMGMLRVNTRALYGVLVTGMYNGNCLVRDIVACCKPWIDEFASKQAKIYAQFEILVWHMEWYIYILLICIYLTF